MRNSLHAEIQSIPHDKTYDRWVSLLSKMVFRLRWILQQLAPKLARCEVFYENCPPTYFPIQLSQLCTILGPLHNPGPMSRVLWDIFTDQASHTGDNLFTFYVFFSFQSFSPATFSLIKLHIHWLIVGLISFFKHKVLFPRTRLSVQFGKFSVRRLQKYEPERSLNKKSLESISFGYIGATWNI